MTQHTKKDESKASDSNLSEAAIEAQHQVEEKADTLKENAKETVKALQADLDADEKQQQEPDAVHHSNLAHLKEEAMHKLDDAKIKAEALTHDAVEKLGELKAQATTKLGELKQKASETLAKFKKDDQA